MSATIHFYLRTDRPNKDGAVQIYLFFTLSRSKRLKIATGKFVTLKKEHKKLGLSELSKIPSVDRDQLYCWDYQRERVLKGAPNWEAINNYLDSQKHLANEAILKLQMLNRPVTVESFKHQFLRPAATNNFFEYFTHEVEKRKPQLAEGTYRGLKGQISKINTFKPNLTLGDIDYRFLTLFENYMLKPKVQKGLGNQPCSVARTMKVIRALLQIAMKNGDFPKDAYPFKDYKIRYFDPVLTTRDYLEPEDLLKVEQLLSPEKIDNLSNGEIKATKRFLFSCYTGLRFSDVIALSRKKHIFAKWVRTPDGKQTFYKHYIELRMAKTDIPVMIPLIDKALELIDESKSDQIFEPISNQKMNQHLKEINKKAGLNKKLSFHVARHSFATICFLYGIPEKVGQQLLGHKSRKFTEVYTHLSQNKVFYEMDKLNVGLNGFELLVTESDGTLNSMKELLPILQKLSPEKLDQVKGLIKLIGK